jgi:hypothetical protein
MDTGTPRICVRGEHFWIFLNRMAPPWKKPPKTLGEATETPAGIEWLAN